MVLEIGKEYLATELDFLTKMPWRETKLTYLGRHPYDNRHLFASEVGGTLLVPDGGEFFKCLSDVMDSELDMDANQRKTAFPCSKPEGALILETMAKSLYERENRGALNVPLPWDKAAGVERRKAKHRAKCAFDAIRTAGFMIVPENKVA